MQQLFHGWRGFTHIGSPSLEQGLGSQGVGHRVEVVFFFLSYVKGGLGLGVLGTIL